MTSHTDSIPSTTTASLRANVGRQNCTRHRSCLADVCPYEPWKRKKRRQKYERVCFYLREAAKAKGTSRSESMKIANPDPADEARNIAGKTSRDFILGLSPAVYRSSVTRETDQ